MTVKSSSLPTSSRMSSERWGMIAPNRNAPKMAWMPMRSVATALTRIPTNRLASSAPPS